MELLDAFVFHRVCISMLGMEHVVRAVVISMNIYAQTTRFERLCIGVHLVVPMENATNSKF